MRPADQQQRLDLVEPRRGMHQDARAGRAAGSHFVTQLPAAPPRFLSEPAATPQGVAAWPPRGAVQDAATPPPPAAPPTPGAAGPAGALAELAELPEIWDFEAQAGDERASGLREAAAQLRQLLATMQRSPAGR